MPYHPSIHTRTHRSFANINQLPVEIIFIILGFLFDDGTGFKSGPAGILEGESPGSYSRSLFARNVVRINRSFKEVATKILWTTITVDTVDQLRLLGQATNDNPSLGAMTRRIDIEVKGPVNIVPLNRLLQYMKGLETALYYASYKGGGSHADVVIDSLCRFCPNLRHAVFEAHHYLSPTPRSLLRLFRTHKKLEVLHVDDVCPPKAAPTARDYYDRSIPNIPPGFEARSLRVLSLGDSTDGEGWEGEGGVASEFWKQFPAMAFPKLEKLCCLTFTPTLLPFVLKQSTSIRHLEITSCNKFFYVNPDEKTSEHILHAAVDVIHLTFRVDFPSGMDTDSLKTWQPLPKSHPTLQRITILPENYSSTRHGHLGRALKRLLSAIVAVDLPRLRLVEIERSIARREDIASSGWFSRLMRELENKKGGGIIVEILETEPLGSWWALEAPGYGSDISL